MPGPTERSPSGAIIDFFAGRRNEPVTAQEVASNTEYARRNVRKDLETLVDQGILRTKELEDGQQVW